MNTQGESGAGVGSDHVTADPFEAEPVSQRVIEGVADALDADITEIEPLYTVIDPDALNNLFGPTTGGLRTGGKVVFTMAGCEVVVNETGAVEVTPEANADSEESRFEQDTGPASE